MTAEQSEGSLLRLWGGTRQAFHLRFQGVEKNGLKGDFSYVNEASVTSDLPFP